MAIEEKDLKVNAYGLVTIIPNFSEAGIGLRKGEVRGVDVETALVVCNQKITLEDGTKGFAATLYTPTKEEAKQVAADAAASAAALEAKQAGTVPGL